MDSSDLKTAVLAVDQILEKRAADANDLLRIDHVRVRLLMMEAFEAGRQQREEGHIN